MDKLKLSEEEISILKGALSEASSSMIEDYRIGQADKSIIGPIIKEYSRMLRKLGGEPTEYVKRCFPEV